MTLTPDSQPNADEIAFWNGDAGTRWAALQEQLDGLFAGLTAAAVSAAAPKPGHHVLDIGCGCGATVLALAQRVGPEGQVLGIDVSAVMLDVARRRVAREAAGNARLLLADASLHSFEPASVDLVFSRFGVMFFDRPAQAFANLRSALKPGGRLVFACWRSFAENPWFAVPYEAAKPHLPPQERPQPGAPGPFSLADPDHVKQMLGEAGFSSVAVVPHDAMLDVAGPGEVEAATRLAAQIGPLSRALKTASPEQRAAAESAVRAALAAYDGADGLKLPASLWFVSAR